MAVMGMSTVVAPAGKVTLPAVGLAADVPGVYSKSTPIVAWPAVQLIA